MPHSQLFVFIAKYEKDEEAEVVEEAEAEAEAEVFTLFNSIIHEWLHSRLVAGDKDNALHMFGGKNAAPASATHYCLQARADTQHIYVCVLTCVYVVMRVSTLCMLSE